jgi:diguanylate cyclase (GGDEF)-like protein
MKRPAFLRSLESELRQQELRRFIRSVGVIEALLLVVVATYCLLAPLGVANITAVTEAMGVFALASILFRVRRLFPPQTRLKLTMEAWAMTAFITVVLWYTGGDASPLLGMYLLPITVSALALGRFRTLQQVLAVCILYLVLAAASPGVDAWTTSDVGNALARLIPLLLVAYLISALAADIFAARRRIENLAQTDSLTGLLNLRTFNDLHRHAHATAESDSQPYGVLMVDMDNLKVINDQYGHEAGNGAIVLVANCIRRTVRTSDVAARFGGDEFVVFLPGVDAHGASGIAHRLRNLVFNSTLDVGERIIRCSISIGVAAYPRDGRDARELLMLADRRMYKDKELHRPPAAEVQAQSS